MPILELDFSRARPTLGFGTLRLGPVGGSLTARLPPRSTPRSACPSGTVPAGLKLGDATVRYRLFGGWHR